MRWREKGRSMSAQAYHIRATLLPHETEPTDVWVKDGRLTFSPVQDAQTLDAKYMSLGLVDSHVHLSIDFGNSDLPPSSPELVLHNAYMQLRAGVTAVRDAGYVQDLPLDGVHYKPMPTVLRSGWIHVPEGRYFPGIDVGKSTEPGELLARLDEVAAEGLSWFKIIADFPDGDMNLLGAPLTYPLEEVHQVVEAAHRRGMRVMVHSTGPHINDLIKAGVDAIEHGMSATPETVELMAKHRVLWTPTMGAIESFLMFLETQGLPDALRLDWSARLSKCLPLAVSKGVRVLVGTDELAHGALVDEMLVMQRHGLSAVQLLDAATNVARQALHLPGFEGAAPADLVLWDDDPRENLKVAGSPKMVLSAGQLVDLETPPNVPWTDIPVRVRLMTQA